MPKATPSKHLALPTQGQKFGRQVRMTRGALRLTIAGLAALAGISPNTIRQVERGQPALSPTIDAIRGAISGIDAIEWLEDDGQSFGLRLHYHKLPTEPLKRATKVRLFRNPRKLTSDERAIIKKRASGDAELERELLEMAEHDKRWTRDKRVKLPCGPVTV